MSGEVQVSIIEDSLDEFQKIVGGYVEAVEHRGYTFWCNEDGIGLELPFNRWVGDHAIHGTFFVTRSNSESIDGEAVGLKAEDIVKVRAIFAKKAVA